MSWVEAVDDGLRLVAKLGQRFGQHRLGRGLHVGQHRRWHLAHRHAALVQDVRLGRVLRFADLPEHRLKYPGRSLDGVALAIGEIVPGIEVHGNRVRTTRRGSSDTCA